MHTHALVALVAVGFLFVFYSASCSAAPASLVDNNIHRHLTAAQLNLKCFAIYLFIFSACKLCAT